MTIEKGAAWGELVPFDAGVPVATSDADAAAELHRQHERGESPVVRMMGGELAAMLGSGNEVTATIRPATVWRFPVDLGIVEVGHVTIPFLASLVVRGRSWRSGVAFMNAQAVRGLRLGHRAHPNDGFLDRVEWVLRFTDLPIVRRRAQLGAHTPHPSIAERRVRSDHVTFRRFDRCEIDGRTFPVEHGAQLRVTIVPDAGAVDRPTASAAPDGVRS